jgi:hypothetical protein
VRIERGTRYGDTPADDNDDYFLTAVEVRQRYGNASDMWLWRRLREKAARRILAEPKKWGARR